MNLSLYSLRNQYIEKENKTTFFIKFDQDPNQWQIGNALPKSHYLAIDMQKHIMIVSPINRFPDSFFSSVYVIRFIVMFFLFTVCTGIGVGIWQNFANPNLRNKIRRDEDGGINLMRYNRPNDQESFED